MSPKARPSIQSLRESTSTLICSRKYCSGNQSWTWMKSWARQSGRIAVRDECTRTEQVWEAQELWTKHWHHCQQVLRSSSCLFREWGGRHWVRPTRVEVWGSSLVIYSVMGALIWQRWNWRDMLVPAVSKHFQRGVRCPIPVLHLGTDHHPDGKLHWWCHTDLPSTPPLSAMVKAISVHTDQLSPTLNTLSGLNF